CSEFLVTQAPCLLQAGSLQMMFRIFGNTSTLLVTGWKPVLQMYLTILKSAVIGCYFNYLV
ncbi:hypothetical protein, partial [Dapis sp. BLCC M172]|uniref:hypothetical protein n=1 Tax=Dapis sp. BLCC M172 TaxID=2975281 RepID=UPI003CF8261A